MHDYEFTLYKKFTRNSNKGRYKEIPPESILPTKTFDKYSPGFRFPNSKLDGILNVLMTEKIVNDIKTETSWKGAN